MYRSESISQLAAALAAAQGSFPSIPRDRTVRVKTRTGGEYTFSYAPLDTILDAVRPALAANGLALVQGVVRDERGAEYVRTTLLHSSGEWLAHDQPLFAVAADNASQGYASGMTYARRYGVTALLCIAADEDDDGNAANGNTAQRVDRPDRPRNGNGKDRAKATEVITEAQASELEALMTTTSTEAAAFLQWLGVQSLDKLPADRFAFARAALEKKARKMAEAAQSDGGAA